MSTPSTLARPWSALRTPSFWLLLGSLAISGLGTLLLLGFMAWTAPRSAVLTLPLLVGYLLAGLLLLRYLDHVGHRPWWMVALALLWGATAAVLAGGGSGLFLDNVLAKAISPWFAADWGAAIVAPTGEEVAKALGVVFLLLAARPYLRTVFAGAIYGATIGLGFTVVEDATYAWGAADETLPDNTAEAVRILALRIAVPGLVSHPLFTAVVGAGIAYFAVRTERTRSRRWAVLAAAFALAWLGHAVVNSPLAFDATVLVDRLPGFAPLAGYFVAVTIPGAVGLFWLATIRRAEAAELINGLAAGSPPVASTEEAAGLVSRRDRARAVRQAGRSHGRPAARAVRRVHRVLLRVADLPVNTAPDVIAPAITPPPVPPPAHTSWEPAPSYPGWGPPPVTPPGLAGPPGWVPAGPVRLTPRQHALVELGQARADLARLTGSTAVPVPTSIPIPVGGWPGWAAAGVALAGLAHWALALVLALLVAVPLVISWRRLRPVGRGLFRVAVAAGFSGYVWLASLLAVVLYPDLT